MDLNVGSTVSLARLLIPRMMYRRQLLQQNRLRSGNGGSRILLISSIASVAPGPSIAVYSASKAFISSFAQALRRELLSTGVFVTLAQPGPLKGTNFFSATKGEDFSPLLLKIPFFSLTAEEAARQIVEASRLGRDMVTPGVLSKLYVHVLSKVTPVSYLASSVQV